MIISNELFQTVCSMDNNTAKGIATILKSKTKERILTGFLLTDAFDYGYVKAVNLLIKLLSCDINSKEKILKQINSIDLSSYLHYSCKSCFNEGFILAINQFSLEIENINDKL